MAYKQLKLWFDKDLAIQLANKVSLVYPGFNSGHFVQTVAKGVEQLELKDRVEYIADRLYDLLDNDYKTGSSILLSVLGPENKLETGMFANFYWVMPIAKYVEKYGTNEFDISMKAIKEITKRNTGEYTIRPFLVEYPEQTIGIMMKWSCDDNFHVRRLASEGGRPRLPWATKLQQYIDDPRPLLPILNNLKNDPSSYVRKSVANCLHDILKDNMTIGKEIISEWAAEPSKESTWIIKHSLRTLRKQDNKWAGRIIDSISD